MTDKSWLATNLLINNEFILEKYIDRI